MLDAVLITSLIFALLVVLVVFELMQLRLWRSWRHHKAFNRDTD